MRSWKGVMLGLGLLSLSLTACLDDTTSSGLTDATGSTGGLDVSAPADAADGSVEPDLTAPDQGSADTGSDLAAPDLPPLDVGPPDVSAPDVALPDVPAPDVALPDVPAPDVPLPDVPEPDVPLPDVPEPDVPLPDVPEPDVPEPDSADPCDGVLSCECMLTECLPADVVDLADLACQSIANTAPACVDALLTHYTEQGCAGSCGRASDLPALSVLCHDPACASAIAQLGVIVEDPCAACPPACEPSCDGKVCGPDGCDGWCGECAQGEACIDGGCVGDLPTCMDAFDTCVDQQTLPLDPATACAIVETTACGALLLYDYGTSGCGEPCEGVTLPGFQAFCEAPECAAYAPLLGDLCSVCFGGEEPDGACLDEPDYPWIVQPGQPSLQATFDCAQGCALLGIPTDQCVADCLSEGTPMTADCRLCFGDLAECALVECFDTCSEAPDLGCFACLTAQGCTSPFLQCSGLQPGDAL